MNRPFLAVMVLALGACSTPEAKEKPIDLNATRVTPGPTGMRRLSQLQYRNTIRDLLGKQIVVPPQLEPDVTVEGLISVGSSFATVSPLGVERYESAGRKIGDQAVANGAIYNKIVPCKPASTDDAACMSKFVASFGAQAWRRPLTSDEKTRVTAIGTSAALSLGDFKAGVSFAIAALLSSPNFLFRAELGTGSKFDDYELASRLSYFLNNTMPDAELFEAAAKGKLGDEKEVRAQAERLMEKPDAHTAVGNFFAELFKLYELDHLTKDTLIFTFMNADLGPDAREETLRLIDHLVFEKDADYRTLFTTQETFVNRRLAALYEVAAPVTDGFAKVVLPKELGRRGFLGQASFLALQSHPVATSAVLRGKFVRTVLLCAEIPPPPTGVNTGIPEANAKARTLRERSKVHQAEPVCAGCHNRMDPIGLGFENFDGVGRWRLLDHEAEIDASGAIDGKKFANAWGLSKAVAEHPDLPACLTRSVFRYAQGRTEEYEETMFLETLTKWFVQNGYRVKPLFVELAASKAFRTAGVHP